MSSTATAATTEKPKKKTVPVDNELPVASKPKKQKKAKPADTPEPSSEPEDSGAEDEKQKKQEAKQAQALQWAKDFAAWRKTLRASVRHYVDVCPTLKPQFKDAMEITDKMNDAVENAPATAKHKCQTLMKDLREQCPDTLALAGYGLPSKVREGVSLFGASFTK